MTKGLYSTSVLRNPDSVSSGSIEFENTSVIIATDTEATVAVSPVLNIVPMNMPIDMKIVAKSIMNNIENKYVETGNPLMKIVATPSISRVCMNIMLK